MVYTKFLDSSAVHIPQTWEKTNLEKEIHLKWWDGYDQPKLHVRTAQSFNINASYYMVGLVLRVHVGNHVMFKDKQLYKTLHDIESWPCCKGVGNRYSSLLYKIS